MWNQAWTSNCSLNRRVPERWDVLCLAAVLLNGADKERGHIIKTYAVAGSLLRRPYLHLHKLCKTVLLICRNDSSHAYGGVEHDCAARHNYSPYFNPEENKLHLFFWLCIAMALHFMAMTIIKRAVGCSCGRLFTPHAIIIICWEWRNTYFCHFHKVWL